MDLFDNLIDAGENLLPEGGILNYHGRIMRAQEADHYLMTLLETIAWKNDEAIIMGKHILTRRKVAWYGDKPFDYSYSRISRRALPWTDSLLELKARVEQASDEYFNSCLLNLYHSGEEGMAWHSDDEKDLKSNGAIGSLSFGAERKFAFKHKRTKQTVSLVLQHGSLLVMKGTTQSNWLHRLPPTRKINEPRINLTFRTITQT